MALRRNRMLSKEDVEDLHRRGDLKGLAKVVRGSDLWVGQFAAEFLVTRQRLDFLLPAMSDTNPDVRELAARALGRSTDARAVDVLIRALNDDDEEVRNRAARSLNEIGDPRAIDPLMALFSDKYPPTRYEVVMAMQRFPRKEAAAQLIAILKGDQGLTRLEAVRALRKLGPEDQIIEALRSAARDDEMEKVRREAEYALEELDPSH